MPDSSHQSDADIVRAAYADRVKELFRVLAENLGMGESPKTCQERFARSLDLVKRAQNMALEAMAGPLAAEPVRPPEPAAVVEPAMAFAVDQAGLGSSGLSPQDQALIDSAIAGTRGTGNPSRRP